MEIRFAEVKDTPGILALLQQVGALHHTLRPDLFRKNACKYGPSQLFSLMERTDTPIFVAVEEENVLGYCFCQIHVTEKDPVLENRECLYIDDLCVLEGCRGKHIGTKLYDEVVRYAKMRRCHAITLNVWEGNDTARAFYDKMGFTPQKTVMEKVL